MNIKPIKNNIIFQFVDRVNSQGQFEKDRTDSGIYLQASVDDSAKQPRWVNVVAVGPGCETVKPGMQALLPNLRWTSYFSMDGQKYWKTDEKEVVAVRDSNDSRCNPLADWVIFVERKAAAAKSSFGIVVVGGQEDTQTGLVTHLGPKCMTELEKSTIYHAMPNFSDKFQHGGFDLAFIKEENILAYVPKE
jgi:co-chaperonin GroES (HSP10)